MRLFSIVALPILLLGLASPGLAEIYRWTDAQGRVHFSQDLGQVPPAKRAAARAEAARRRPDPVQRYSLPGSPAAPLRSFSRPASRPGTLRIPFERRGTLMMVSVRVNDRVTAPFLVDTGASSISIPRALATQIGIHIGPDTPREQVQTANGVVSEPVVQLASVQTGDARVENLRAFVSSSMDIGLLGGSFFNNFVYQVDSAAGEISLRRNERVRSGLTEDQWRGRFRQLRGSLSRLDHYLANTRLLRASRVKELEERRENLQAALADLERQANQASVPRTWRQ